MTDDILTKLKAGEHVGAKGKTQLNVSQLLLNRAAAREIERLRKELRDLQIAYAKDTDELEKELTVTKFQLAYWREIALENQTNG